METALLLLILLLPLLLWWLAQRHGGTQESCHGGLGLVLCISICSALAYVQLGAFGQWQQAYVDQHIDLQLAGRITEARRQLAKTPQQPQLMLELVALYNQGGLYPEAVALQQQLIEIQGQQPELLAQLAELQYYRDQRQLSDSTCELLGQVFRQQPAQLQARMLLANALFQRQQYLPAIAQWQWLLAQPQYADYQQPLQTAIEHARKLLRQSSNRTLVADNLRQG